MNDERFFKIYWTDSPEDNEVLGSGAVQLYKILWQNLARKHWVDQFGCPLKRDYFDKGILACSLSIPLLMGLSGHGERKIKRWIKALVKAKWITVKRGVLGGRNITTLGKHRGTGKAYRELLFKDDSVRLKLPISEADKFEIWKKKQDPLMLEMLKED